ncbi:hypothetical protein HYW61_00605 [candidate division WWE3 bacterium]|nr:hypothetical protein [candidate division WWE3 bacterium]
MKYENELLKSSAGAFFLVMLVLIAVQLYVTNMVALKGSELARLESRKLALNEDTSGLEIALSRLSSLSNVEREAFGLGFVRLLGNISAIGPSTVASIGSFQ